MTTRGYHHGALRQAILDAAVDEARRGGPQAVGVRSLAKAVGVSPSAVYRHIPSIEALLAEVAQVARETFAAQLIEYRDRAPRHRTRKAAARERFRAVGRGYVDFARHEPHLFDTAFVPTTVAPPRPDDPSAWEVLINGVTELAEVGLIRADAIEDAALIAWSGVHGIATILVRRMSDVDDDAAIEVVLSGVIRSLETL